MRKSLTFLFILAGLTAAAQSKTEKYLRDQVRQLADDQLKGRETGTTSELVAASQIMSQMLIHGVQPAGPNDRWFQAFPYNPSIRFDDSTLLTINTKRYSPGTSFFPLNFSASGRTTGEVTDAGYGVFDEAKGQDELKNVRGKIAIIHIGLPGGIHPHNPFLAQASLKYRATRAEQAGATGIIFINPEKDGRDPAQRQTYTEDTLRIPVVFASGMAVKQLLDGTAPAVTIQTGLTRLALSGWNVIGKIDHQAAGTVVIGAHYDHLGMGDEGSLHRGEPAIHNGADDNASGVALMLSLAKELRKKKYKHYNYLLVAFSGEEKGLLGSSWFLDNPVTDTSAIAFMINFDMVGRLDSGNLIINGTGTSPAWENLLADAGQENLQLVLHSDGMGPSDHASFYMQGIPAIHLFTGAHGEYHKPGDDAALLNYSGMLSIRAFVLDLLKQAPAPEKFVFTETQSKEKTSMVAFKVTLGIIPDYGYSGNGVRVDGVSADRPAANAGVRKDDVIIMVNDLPINNLQDYMQMLTVFEPGDAFELTVIRGGEKLVLNGKF